MTSTTIKMLYDEAENIYLLKEAKEIKVLQVYF